MPSKLTIETFICKANIIHDNFYHYYKFIYISTFIRGIIVCPKHGEFSQTPKNHLLGHGCSSCAGNKKMNTEEFIKKANIKHKEKYDYSKVNYINIYRIIEIICRKHGSFWQVPNDHLSGHGCKKCRSDNLNKMYKKDYNIFIEQAKKIHHKFYDYSKFIYINCMTKGIIICPKHGDFIQTSDTHLRGAGCPNCTHRISKPEIQFLDHLNILRENRQVKINRKKVDGFDSDTNTIYEFLGDYWHGNLEIYNPNDIHPKIKKSYKDINQNTFNRFNQLKSSGYSIKYIWENDWKKFKKGIDQTPKIIEL